MSMLHVAKWMAKRAASTHRLCFDHSSNIFHHRMFQMFASSICTLDPQRSRNIMCSFQFEICCFTHRVSCVCELDLHGFATSKSWGGMKLRWCVVLQGLLERFDELGGIIIQARLQRKRCSVTSFWKVARKNVVRLFRNVGCRFCFHPW